MSETKHTLNWAVQDYYWIIDKETGKRIASVFIEGDTDNSGNFTTSNKNAHLIAAAPDMLEALKGLTADENGEYFERLPQYMRDIIVAVIEKTTGGIK